MPILIPVGKVVLLVCIKSASIMSFPALTINKTLLNCSEITNALLDKESNFLCARALTEAEN